MSLRDEALAWFDENPTASATDVATRFEGRVSAGTWRVWKGRFRPEAKAEPVVREVKPRPAAPPKPVGATPAPEAEAVTVAPAVAGEGAGEAPESDPQGVRVVDGVAPPTPRARATPWLRRATDDGAPPQQTPQQSRRNTPAASKTPKAEAPAQAEAPRWTSAGGAAPTPREPPAAIPHSALTEAQQIALGYLLDARPVVETVNAAGCTRTELRAWQRDPVFAGVLSELRAERRLLLMEGLSAGADESVTALRCAARGDLLPNGTAPSQVTVKAAVAILERIIPKTEKVEHSGNGGVLQVRGLKELSREQLEALAGEDDEDEAATG